MPKQTDQEKLNDILKNFDNDYSSSFEARKEAINDIFFSRVSQWDDWLSNFVKLEYRGQFDIVKPVVRKLVAEIRQNPIQVMFRPKEGADPDSADLMQSMYRADVRGNGSVGAINIAVREQLEAGYGAWRWVTEYDDSDPLSNNQRAKRVPIHEAASCVIWDSNSIEMDKSDASRVTIITGFSESGWDKFCEDNDIDSEEFPYPTFQSPNQSWDFPWVLMNKVYVGEYYEREYKWEKIFLFSTPFSDESVAYWQKDIKDVIDELAEAGYEKVGEKRVKRPVVTKYLVTSTDILKKQRIACDLLPVVPAFGEWGFAGGKEVYEGVVRLMKDAQRARNTIMSFNMDIVSESPRSKPIFWPEQIAGFEDMYDGSDAYPYYLMNPKDEQGNDLPNSPVGYLNNPEIPQANSQMLADVTQAVKEVSGFGVKAQDVAGQQVAFDTVNQLNQRADLESFVFIDNLASAMRRDGEIYSSFVRHLYDVPRAVLTLSEDGTEKQVMLLEQVVDYASGETVTLNDIRGSYETYVDVGPSYQSQKDANKAQLIELMKIYPPDTPVGQILALQFLTLQDGKVAENVRKYANQQLVIMGIKQPETPEDEQALVQAQQAKQNQQDPNMVLAQAELLNAQAQMLKAQDQNDQTRIKLFTAQADVTKSNADAAKAIAETEAISDKGIESAIKLLADIQGKQSDRDIERYRVLLQSASKSANQAMPQQAQPETVTAPQ